ncbi:MAG: multidrug effflux MFS transporter [Pseudomonadota bacterium]
MTARPLPPHGRIVLLAAITALGSLAIHMFVPAMPRAALSLHTSRSAVQLALTFYMAGVAAGQIATGPLSDRIGRRPVLVGGALLFVAGSALCWAAGSIAALLVGRVVQALGASSGLVAGRAMIGDAGGEGARDMALLSAIVLLSPMFAPLLGSLLADAAGWRAIFAVLAVLGLAVGVAIARWLPETMGERERSNLWADWAQLAREPVFLRNLAIATLMSGGLYVFLSASPFLLVEIYHVRPGDMGLCYGLVASGAAGGALTASAIAKRWAVRPIMNAGSLVSAGAALALLAGVLLGSRSIVALVAPMMVFAFGGGLVMPNAMMAALSELRGRIGTAVSIYGALQMGGSALATFAVALLPSHEPLLPAALIAGLTVSAALLQRLSIVAFHSK